MEPKTHKALVIILLVFSCLWTRYLPSQTKYSSLSDYVSAALRTHPLLGSAHQAKASAAYASESIQKGYYPQIRIDSHVLVAPGYDEVVTNGGEFGAQIAGSYTVYDGGARSYEIQKGELGVQQGTLNVDRVRADIIFAVSNAFALAVKEKRGLIVAEQSSEQLKDYLELVRQIHASGQGSETDVLKTTVEFNNARIDVESRTTAYANALLTLAEESGLPSLEVVDVDSAETSLRPDTTLNAQRNVDLVSQEALLRQAQLEAQLAESKLRPAISLVADAGALSSLPTLRQGLSNVFGASVGLSFSVPLFTFSSLQNSYDAARASANSISLQNDYSRNSLTQEFRSTINAFTQARSQIIALQKNLDVADQNFLLSKARYTGGNGLSLEVLDAIQTINQIKLAIEEARYHEAASVFKLNRLNSSTQENE